MLRKLISLVAVLALAACGEGPTAFVLEDPDGDPIIEEETGRGLTGDPQPEPEPVPQGVAGRTPVRIKNLKN